MEQQQQNNRVSEIIKGYRSFFILFLKSLSLLGAIVGINLILIYPLWYSAIHFREFYTYVVGILLLSGIVFVIIKNIINKINRERQYGRSPAQILLKPVINFVKFLAVFIFLYIFALLLHRHHLFTAIGGLLVFLVVTSYSFSVKK